jgi:hypothetical protein
MSSKELVETALRVLVAWTDGRKPLPADVNKLQTAFPSLAHLSADNLAVSVVHHLSGRVLREPGQNGETTKPGRVA